MKRLSKEKERYKASSGTAAGGRWNLQHKTELDGAGAL